MPRRAAAALSFFFLAAAPPPAPAPSPQALLSEMEALELKPSGRHPLDRREKESRLAAYGEKFRALQTDAVPLLSWYVSQKERPLKIRLYAAAFLGLIADIGAFPALSQTALDKSEDAGLRAAALSSAGSLGVPVAQMRRLLERCAREAPEPLLREAFLQLSFIGAEDASLAYETAKRAGFAPAGLDRGTAAHAVEALGRARSAEAQELLFKLLAYFRAGSPPRAKVLTALNRRLLAAERARDRKRLGRERLEILLAALKEESGPAALSAARLLGALGDGRAVSGMTRKLKASSDPALLAELAQALAAIGDPKAGEAVLELERGLVSDKRFAHEPGGPDTGALALRIEKAALSFAPRAPGSPVSAPREKPRPAVVSADSEAASLPFSYQGWPGAGAPKLAFNGAVSRLRLREKPDRASRVAAEAAPEKGVLIAYDDSVVVMLKPGRVRANAAFSLEVREFGPLIHLSARRAEEPAPKTALSLSEGDQLEVLAYREGGECYLRAAGVVYLGGCPADDPKRFDVLSVFETEWWLHAAPDGRAGWLFSEDEGLDFLPRW